MITKEQAGSTHTFYHKTMRNADGTAVRCRANGKLRTWKRRPEAWRLPVKYGLKNCFYIDHDGTGVGSPHSWMTFDPTDAEAWANGVGMTRAPFGAVADRLEELGRTEDRDFYLSLHAPKSI